MHALWRALLDREALAMLVYRDRRLMAVLDCPDDVLWTPCGVAAEEHTASRGFESGLVDDGHVMRIECDADVTLDPGKCVVLSDCQNDFVAGNDDCVDHGARLPAVVVGPAETFELHADELPVLDDEALRRVILDDADSLFIGVFQLPGRGLEIPTRPSRHDLRIDTAQSA